MRPTIEEIEDKLQAMYDVIDSDDEIAIGIIEFVHDKLEECREHIKNNLFGR